MLTMTRSRPSLFIALISSLVWSEAQSDPLRQKVDVTVHPWSAIGQVNNSNYGRCTGVLISRSLAVTAAHCLYSRRTGRLLRPSSIHFVLGYNRGKFAFQTTAESFRVGAGYDPTVTKKADSSDWALLQLKDAAPVGMAPVAISRQPLVPDRSFVAAGFAQDRSEVLTVSPPCQLLGVTAEGIIIGNCIVPHGYSGGPLLDQATGEMVGLSIVAGTRDGADFVGAIEPSQWTGDVKP